MAEGKKELTLSDGRKAVIMKGTGRDLLNAQRKGNNSASEIQWALLAEITEIDGKKQPWENYLDLPLEDVIMLFTEFSELFGNFQSPALSTSSILQKPQDGALGQ